MTTPVAFEDGDFDQPTNAYREWIIDLETNVIQEEFGYEPGEFTVYMTHWATLYEEGLTPRQAWQRALDGFAQKRRDDEAARQANYARIVSEDEAAVARSRAHQQQAEVTPSCGCAFCDIGVGLHEDAQGFHHVAIPSGERIPCDSQQTMPEK